MARVSGAVGLLLAGAAVLHAQTSDQPNLVLSITGGLTTGQRLWTLPHQLVPYGCTSSTGLPPCTGSSATFDTLRLGRRLRPGPVGSLSAAYFRSAHFGYVLEFGYFGVESEGRCEPVVPYHADSEDKNQQACEAVQGAHFRTSLVAFQAGLTYRARVGRVSPYVKGTAGIGALGNSFVQAFVTVFARGYCSPNLTCNQTLPDEDRRRSATFVSTLAAGLTVPLGPGYQARAEVRDLIAGIPIAADSSTPTSAQPFPVARTGTRTRHVLVVTMGIDVILERRHRRRY